MARAAVNNSQEALSARELAELSLPGLPRTKVGLLKRSGAEEWPFFERRGASGQTERAFPVRTLPEYVRLALLEDRLSDESSLVTRGLGDASGRFASATPGERERAVQRAQAVERFKARTSFGVDRGEALRCTATEVGCSVRTLRRWLDYSGGSPDPAKLAPKRRGPKSGPAASCPPEAWEWLLSDYLRLEQPAFAACYRRLLKQAKKASWSPIPKESALRRRLKNEIPATTLVLRREGDRAFEAKQPSMRRTRKSLRPLEWVNADGHKFDVFVLLPDGRTVRPILVAWQDVYSSKILSWRLSETESLDAVRSSLGDLLMNYGIPGVVYIDNGRAFNAKELTGRQRRNRNRKAIKDEMEGVLKTLGIELAVAKPYNGRSKPIERAFRDLAEDISRHPDCAGAYTGNSPNSKPENYGSKAIPLDQFRRLVEEQILEHNARTGRVGEGQLGRSFDQTFEEGCQIDSFVPRRTTREQVLWALLPAKELKVPAKGEIVLTSFGARFWSDQLLQIQGERVTVRFDPTDISRGLFVFREEKSLELFCHAPILGVADFNSREDARREQRARSAEKKHHKKMAALRGGSSLEHPAPSHKPLPPAKVVQGAFGLPAKRAAIPGADKRQANQAARRDLGDVLGKKAFAKLEDYRGKKAL